MIETALETDKGLHRQSPKVVISSVVDVVTGQESLVVLLDGVAVDGVVKKQAKVRPELNWYQEAQVCAVKI